MLQVLQQFITLAFMSLSLVFTLPSPTRGFEPHEGRLGLGTILLSMLLTE